jgi:hypothetical protein
LEEWGRGVGEDDLKELRRGESSPPSTLSTTRPEQPRRQRKSNKKEERNVPSSLLQHVQHLGLKDVVDRFDRHARPRLGHREHVHHRDLSTRTITRQRLAKSRPEHREGREGTQRCIHLRTRLA